MAPQGKLVSEMLEEHQAFLDQVETTTRCAFCSWVFTGAAIEGRVQAALHRASDHPEVKPRSRRELEAEIRREAQSKVTKRREERTLARPAVVEEVAVVASDDRLPIPAVNDFEARRRRRRAYSREEILERFRLFYEQFGRYPTMQDIPKCAYLPSQNGVDGAFGSWAAPFVALGWEPPVKGRRRSSGANPPEAPVRTQEPLSEAAAIPDDLLVAFLYLLGRDRLTLGAIEAVVRDAEETSGSRIRFSNAHLEAYARDVAGRLVESRSEGGAG